MIFARGEKVIVWSSFIENVDYFYKKYKDLNPAKIHGKLAIEERNKSVEKFLNDASCKVLFATPQSAKEGLTLTVFKYSFFISSSNTITLLAFSYSSIPLK